MDDTPYLAAEKWCYTGKPTMIGPGIDPLIFGSFEEAQRAAELANAAFKAGYRQAQKDMRRALGVDYE
jgi:hypothetical protein